MEWGSGLGSGLGFRVRDRVRVRVRARVKVRVRVRGSTTHERIRSNHRKSPTCTSSSILGSKTGKNLNMLSQLKVEWFA